MQISEGLWLNIDDSALLCKIHKGLLEIQSVMLHRPHLLHRASESDQLRMELFDILLHLAHTIPSRVQRDENRSDLFPRFLCTVRSLSSVLACAKL